MVMDDWKPSASFPVLRQRAALFADIRRYFDTHHVMEVDTPLLSSCATVDVYIDSFQTTFNPIGEDRSEQYYLHTSPEFAMKRLLVAGSGDIYFMGKVFRNGEAGGRHNPEFTMLEYYRIGMDQLALMDDMTRLLMSVCDFHEMRRCSYGELFEEMIGINPHTIKDDELLVLVQQKVDSRLQHLDRIDCLDLLFSECIEPSLGMNGKHVLNGVFVYDYPAPMSALSRLRTDEKGQQVASRFELFVNGIELANGYHELLDSDEQVLRFNIEQNKRKEKGFPVYPYDYHLVEALRHNMPDCAGVAMGVDRLLMLMLGTKNISDVVPFDFCQA
ncbi:Elongation factor P--(R)-beta-lysine ligase [invertebrate metagenome]|uniref:Elongation factor P--(R)-beta-lysine ligase n=1 Tax=invertebrate metagenome TaxID=1711999 RepID=A0A2H9TA38_9ZZZZ